MGVFRAVLFDFAHTLFEPTAIEIQCDEFRRRSGRSVDPGGVRVAFEAIRERSRRPDELAKGRDVSVAAHRRCWIELLAPLDDLAVGLAEFTYDFGCSAAGWVPYPDTGEVLAELQRRGIAVAVISDTGWDIRPAFEAHGLTRFVDAFELSYEHGFCKPDPRMFDSACWRLGVLPESALMIGDSAFADGGAAEVGIATMILPTRDRRLEPALGCVLKLTA